MKKTFQLSIITVALLASHAYAAPVWEGPTGTGTGFSNSMGGETNYANVDPSSNGVLIGQRNDVANTSVGIGYDSQAKGENSFSAGSLNNWEGTTGGGDSAISIGRSTYAKGDQSIALGATVTAGGTDSVAVGNSQTVNGDNATAVGRGSLVNGNQASSLGHVAWTGGDGATAIGSETWANAENATVLGFNAETGGKNALNIGHDAHGGGLNAIHIGYKTTGSAENTIVIGSNDPTKPGQPWADDKNSVAIGYNADTHNGGGGSTEDTVSFGGFFTGAVRTISQVADGINDHDAINISQLNDAVASLTSGAELIAHADDQLAVEKSQRIAADADLQAAIDNEAQLRADADTAQTAARISAIDNEAQIRAAADAAEKAARIAGDEALAEARIAGDAAEAAARTAAINAEANARIAGDAEQRAERIKQVNRLDGRIDAEAAERTAEIKRLDGRIDHASRRLNDIEKSAYRGVAIALAAQQAVPNIRSGQVALFAGVGHFEGESAGSVGVVTSFIANRVSLSGAVGFAGGNEVGGRVGLSYSF
ncbi:hypothetical protein F991_02868 [Acinetobacter sp. CIP-A165]|uniref:YadA-like family protein n=1 Tax=Acinetobacter sp. CIP-A165 TaxID=40373 RepID=UPI0002D01CC1|nr:YadA-like family protein [Acinetobacter sp. CIP-A165]ENU29306.1 hypothetical protein F991_02868 [Acinetobacter sp. CIP-A165]